MQQSIVRSVSINHAKMQCKKLRSRSVLRSVTPDLGSARPREKVESPVYKKNELMQYNPETRKATFPLIGEVNLPREEFHLVSPKNSHIPENKKIKYEKILFKTPKILQQFISDSKKMFIYRKNYLECLQKSIKDLKTLNFLTSEVDDLKKVVHSKPLQDPKSKMFIKAAKTGNLQLVRNLLRENPNIIQSFDIVGLTALHWCALRNRMEVAKLLVSSRALVDAIDMVKRTPLFLAVKRDNFELIQFFLINKADPCIVPDPKKSVVDYAKKYLNQEILRKAIIFHKQMKRVPEKERDEKWKNEIVPRFLNFDSIKSRDLKLKLTTFIS